MQSVRVSRVAFLPESGVYDDGRYHWSARRQAMRTPSVVLLLVAVSLPVHVYLCV